MYAANYLGIFKKDQLSEGKKIFMSETDDKNKEEREVKGITIDKVADNLYVPWSIVFLDEQNLLVTERNGKIRKISDGKLLEEPVYTFGDVSTTSEEGLMGMTLDPEFDSNHYLYVCLAYPLGKSFFDKVIRLSLINDQIKEDKIILDKIPAAQYHAGCRLKFGPDQKLYITTGDATDKNIAQDKSSLGGKILRINPDGSIPEDNPFSASPIYSLGHRNPQGLDWDSVSGNLFATEHGPSVFDGPAGGDEINLIKKGENYGWPTVSHEKSKAGLVSPLAVFTPAIAPAEGMFYTGDILPQFKNHFLVGLLKGEGILDVELNSDRATIASYEKIPEISYGRIREIAQSPDGYIYFTTSNRDDRGTLNPGDDGIYKISPKYN
jgi:glucose/arabinose dehydrogenase